MVEFYRGIIPNRLVNGNEKLEIAAILRPIELIMRSVLGVVPF